MSGSGDGGPLPTQQSVEPPVRKEDLTGRDRMVWNVLTSWGGHLVFVVAGFVMPRMIDRHAGQVALGIWDFSWSLVNYFSLAGIGIGASVNRQVAKCRAEGNHDEMNRSVSSVLAVQLVIAAVVLLMTAVAVVAVPSLFAARLGPEAGNASWVIALLGASLAAQMAFDTSRGILTGVHRWDVYNAVNSGGYAVTVLFMIAALVSGGKLRSLAAVHFVTTLATEILRMFLAHRYCPGLHSRLSLASWGHARSMIVFGGKSVLVGISPLIVIQGCSLLIAGNLGPAALAVFSRPGGLVRNAQTFVNKFGFVLTPTAGSLQGAGQEEEIRKLLVRTTRLATCMTIPIILFLAILGDPLLRLWMGARYEAGAVMAIIAAGYLLPTTQMPVLSILVGLNLHGRTGIAVTTVTVLSFGLCALLLNVVGWSLEGAALATAIPLTLGNGVVVMAYACRMLHIPLGEYLGQAFLLPILWNLPYAAGLVVARLGFRDAPLPAVCAGGAALLLLFPIYWRHVLTGRIRDSISERILSFVTPYRGRGASGGKMPEKGEMVAGQGSGPPLVTVVITTYNRSTLLGRAVRSVLGQTFAEWELLIVDDHSPDDTADVVGAFRDPRIRYIRLPVNGGVSKARNAGIRAAGPTRFISFLDDDDEWLPEKLELQLELFATGPDDLGAVGCGRIDHDSNGTREIIPKHRGWIFEGLLARRVMGYAAPLILVRRFPGEEDPLFNEEMPSLEDLDYSLRIALGRRADFVPRGLVNVFGEADRLHVWNPTNTIRGYECLLENYADELLLRPWIARYYRFAIGRELASMNRMDEARENFRISMEGSNETLRLHAWCLATRFGRYGMKACSRFFPIDPPHSRPALIPAGGGMSRTEGES